MQFPNCMMAGSAEPLVRRGRKTGLFDSLLTQQHFCQKSSKSVDLCLL